MSSNEIKKPSVYANLSSEELEYDGSGNAEKYCCIAGIVASALCAVAGVSLIGSSFSSEYKFKGGEGALTAGETSALRSKYSPSVFNYLVEKTGGTLVNGKLLGSGIGLSVVGGVGLGGSIHHYLEEK